MNLDSFIEAGAELIRCYPNTPNAVDKWGGYDSTVRRKHESSKDFEGYNVAIIGGSMIDGRYLYIVDVDPRHDGHKVLIKLAEDRDLPDTLTVRTPGGGRHFYFLSDQKINGCVLAPGIDFIGHGKYAVCPPSIKNERRYLTEMDCSPYELADLPDWLTPNNSTATDSNADLDAIAWDHNVTLEKAPPASGRNNYLTHFGGKLRRVGLSEEQLIEALKAEDIRNHSKPLHLYPDESGAENKARGLRELEGIAKSLMRYEPSLAVIEPVVEVSEPSDTSAEVIDLGNPIERELARIFEKTTGLTRLLSEHILEHAVRKYPHFAMASSFSILSGVSQGGYISPVEGKSLTLYQWLTAPASAGKNAYLSGVSGYVNAVDHRIISRGVRSSQAFRGLLYTFNSRLQVIDEMQDEIAKLKASPLGQEILRDWKELYNDLAHIGGELLRNTAYPISDNPRLSIFSAGTKAGFENVVDSHSVAGGLMSRFIIWPFFDVAEKRPVKPFEVKPGLVDDLTELFNWTLSSRGVEPANYGEDQKTYFNLLEKPQPRPDEYRAQTQVNRTRLKINAEALALFREFERSKEIQFIQLERAGNPQGSVFDRAPSMALKLASLHCVGRFKSELDALDLEVGIGLADALARSQVADLAAHATDSEQEKYEAKILNVLGAKKGALKSREIRLAQTFRVNRVYKDALYHLVACGKVAAIIDNKRIDVCELDSLPRGASYQLYK